MAVRRDKSRRERRRLGGQDGCEGQRREGSVRERERDWKADQDPDFNQCSPIIYDPNDTSELNAILTFKNRNKITLVH